LKLTDLSELDASLLNNGKGLDYSIETIERLSQRAEELKQLKVRVSRHHSTRRCIYYRSSGSRL
jgi:archaellum component FlaC